MNSRLIVITVAMGHADLIEKVVGIVIITLKNIIAENGRVANVMPMVDIVEGFVSETTFITCVP